MLRPAAMAFRWGWPIGLAAACMVAACTSGAGNGPAPEASPKTARPGEYCVNGFGSGMPDTPLGLYTFVTDTGEREITLRNYADPCAPETTLVVIRVSGLWCGTCRWHAAHTGELKALDIGSRLHFLDLLLSDEDNVAWTPFYNETIFRMMKTWRTVVDAPDDVAIDVEQRFRTADDGSPILPLYLLLDRRTMRVVGTLADPGPEEIENAIRKALAEGDGFPAPRPRVIARMDGRFDREERDLIAAMRLPEGPPHDPTNEYEENPVAIELGKKLFFDTALSPHGKSCATCHDPEKSLTDGVARSVGVGLGDRNAPSIALAAHSKWQLWDGAADSLWMQALLPFENPLELDSSRVFVVHRLVDAYVGEYHAIFGTKYPVPDLSGVPRSAKPWNEIANDYQRPDEVLTRPFVNAGKAIAAFVRTIGIEEEPIDRYARGDLGALTDAQKDGLQAFFRAGCAQCHFGPRLTDDAFHVLRWPSAGERDERTYGRRTAMDRVRSHPFNRASRFSDARERELESTGIKHLWSDGAFRTPGLRGVVHTAPYGHAGTFASLAEAVGSHGKTFEIDGPLKASPVEIWLPRLDDETITSITVFMSTFTGRPVVP